MTNNASYKGVLNVYMAPLRGWALRSQRLKAKVPHGRGCAQRMRSIKTMTFLAALRHDRLGLIDGPIKCIRLDQI